MRASESPELRASEPASPFPRFAARPRPATRVLEGEIADPLLSSRTRGWNGLTLELYAFGDLDVVVQPPDHVIAVQLSGSVNLQQTRAGRTRSRTVRAGDVSVTPVGSPTRWRQAGQSVVVLLRLSPSYVHSVAGDECALDPERFEIHGRFGGRDA
ncbi:MAG TPA: hypothetical protein VJ891_18485, partial [Casimicrobiaceae bacterium]|nr:hypothetical protein [Casimicrobiaceae bacterium]